MGFPHRATKLLQALLEAQRIEVKWNLSRQSDSHQHGGIGRAFEYSRKTGEHLPDQSLEPS